MAEVSRSESGFVNGPAMSDKQACAKCASHSVGAVSITSEVVYLRCQACGEVWNIPQRRKTLRADDPRKF